MHVFCICLDCDGYYSNNPTSQSVLPLSISLVLSIYILSWQQSHIFISCFGTTWMRLYPEKMSFARWCPVEIPWVSPGSTMGAQLGGTALMAVPLVASDPLSSQCLLLSPRPTEDRAPWVDMPPSSWGRNPPVIRCGLVSATALFGLMSALEGHQIAAVLLRLP